jgi:hypothetical protein
MSTNRWCGDGGVVEFQIALIEDVVGIHLAGSPRRFRPVVPVHFSHPPCAPRASLPSYQTPPLLRANRDGTHHSQGVKVPMPWSPVPIPLRSPDSLRSYPTAGSSTFPFPGRNLHFVPIGGISQARSARHPGSPGRRSGSVGLSKWHPPLAEVESSRSPYLESFRSLNTPSVA